MTNSSTPSEPSKANSTEEARGYRVRIEHPSLQRYSYGAYTNGEWSTTIRRQEAPVMPLEKALEGANYLALATVKDGAKVSLEAVNSFDPDWCCAPANTIGELISYHRLSQDDAARKLGLSPDGMRLLMRGELEIGPELAHKLHVALGGSPQFWRTLEDNYREGIRMGLTVFREVL